VVDAYPTAENINRLGSLFVAAGDSTRAGLCYTSALRLDSTYVPALYNFSVLSAAQGDSVAARALAERAFRLRPDLQAIKELREHLMLPPAPRP
jgi:tetratricopeptide (TPR) repeat protein